MVFENKMITFDDPEDEEEEAPAEEEEAEGGGDEGGDEGGDDEEGGGDEEEEEEEEEEDMVDPLETIREKCEASAHCVHTKHRLETCEARVGSRDDTEEECTEELFDFIHARDHCVAHKLFHNLK